MRKRYTNPEWMVVALSEIDIVTTSDGGNEPVPTGPYGEDQNWDDFLGGL